jgi:four helix bundle protein
MNNQTYKQTLIKRSYQFSLKSANETKYWLGLLRDSGKSDKIDIDKLLKESIELSNILGSSILSLKGKKE